MSLLVAVPTMGHGRQTLAERLATAASPFCTEVVLAARESAPRLGHLPNARVIEQTPRGLPAARSQLVDLWLASGRDELLLIDDDVKIDWSRLPAAFSERLAQTPWIGAVTSYVRRFAFNHRPLPGGFAFASHPAQLFFLRKEAIQELMREHAPFRDETFPMEDMDLGLRLWEAGWAVARVAPLPGYTHDPLRPQIKKRSDDGGITAIQRAQTMATCIERLWDNHPMSFTALRLLPPGSVPSYTVRFNWPALLAPVRKRWPAVHYDDGRHAL